MKKLLIAVLALGLMIGLTANSEATLLASGGSFVPGDENSPCASLSCTTLDSIIGASFDTSVPLVTDGVQGTYSTWVKQIDSTGFLVFEYTFTPTTAPEGDLINLATMVNFSGFATSAGADLDVGTVDPSLVSRSGGSIQFAYSSPGVGAGGSSALMWIATDASFYKPGLYSLQNGSNDARPAFAPAVPEPTSMLLFGTGMLGFVARRMRKFVA